MQINPNTLSQLNKSLRKAEALATILQMTNLDFTDTNVIDNYLWALSDNIREAKQICNRLTCTD
jgi:hypothetical protein